MLVYWPGMGLDDQNAHRSSSTLYLLVRIGKTDPWRIWNTGFYG